MAISNQRKRNWIRTLYELSLENHISFQEQLARSRKEASEAGFAGVIQSTSGNGLTVSFSGLTPAEAEDALGSIEDLYDTAVDDLANQSTPVASPDDETIRDTMLLLVPKGRVTTVYNDFSAMRP